MIVKIALTYNGATVEETMTDNYAVTADEMRGIIKALMAAVARAEQTTSERRP